MSSLSRRQALAIAALLPWVASPARAATHTVIIEGFRFTPATLTIARGDSVTFTNRDSAPHTATFAGGLDTGRLSRGESATLTFDSAGSKSYECAYHPSMRGTIRVQ